MAAAVTIIAALICATACKPRQSPEPLESGPSPTIVRVHSFARNEVRLDLVVSRAIPLRIRVGHELEEVDLEAEGDGEIRLVFETAGDGISVTSPNGLVERKFAKLSDVEFLTPPFGDGRTVVLGSCRGDNGGSRAIRLETGGMTHCVMPPVRSFPFDLQQYELSNLPAMRDLSAAIAGIRREENNKDYQLCVPHYKPAGRSFMGEACWTLTMWPPNATECAAYMVTVNLPKNQTRVWQVFVIDPESGEISLIRDRETGELISLSDWLELEEKTAVYTLDEMLRGVCDQYHERLRERQRGAGTDSRVGGDLATLEPELP